MCHSSWPSFNAVMDCCKAHLWKQQQAVYAACHAVSDDWWNVQWHCAMHVQFGRFFDIGTAAWPTFWLCFCHFCSVLCTFKFSALVSGKWSQAVYLSGSISDHCNKTTNCQNCHCQHYLVCKEIWTGCALNMKLRFHGFPMQTIRAITTWQAVITSQKCFTESMSKRTLHRSNCMMITQSKKHPSNQVWSR